MFCSEVKSDIVFSSRAEAATFIRTPASRYSSDLGNTQEAPSHYKESSASINKLQVYIFVKLKDIPQISL